jgi:general secretion pathway protein A
MYTEFYGLNDVPFRLAPDPKYLFRTDSLLEVQANLQYGIENGKGLVVVTGEVGTGKTTILRSNLQSMDRSVLAAYIFNPLLSTRDFFDMLTSEFRLRPQASKSGMLRTLGYLLVSRHSKGLRTVLVIDEAHLLPQELLEEIRLLSNFETNREKLLQIILCGQPELHEVLAQPELRQLKQRVSLRCSINPLTAHETAEYIRWRLRIAGAKNERLFEPEAVAMIHLVSGGIPRIINNICDNALLSGYSEASPVITAAIVSEVINVLDLSSMEVLGPHRAEMGLSFGQLSDDEGLQPVRSFSQSPALLDPLGNSQDWDLPSPTPANVHYIRREEPDARGWTSAGPNSPNQNSAGRSPASRNSGGRGNVSFVIEFEGQDDEVETPKYFSRVRVTRRS